MKAYPKGVIPANHPPVDQRIGQSPGNIAQVAAASAPSIVNSAGTASCSRNPRLRDQRIDNPQLLVGGQNLAITTPRWNSPSAVSKNSIYIIREAKICALVVKNLTRDPGNPAKNSSGVRPPSRSPARLRCRRSRGRTFSCAGATHRAA